MNDNNSNIYIYIMKSLYFLMQMSLIFLCMFIVREVEIDSTNLYNRIKKPLDYLEEEFQAFKALNYI